MLHIHIHIYIYRERERDKLCIHLLLHTVYIYILCILLCDIALYYVTYVGGTLLALAPYKQNIKLRRKQKLAVLSRR